MGIIVGEPQHKKIVIESEKQPHTKRAMRILRQMHDAYKRIERLEKEYNELKQK